MLPHPKNWEPHFSAPELGLMRDGKKKNVFYPSNNGDHIGIVRSKPERIGGALLTG